MGIGNIANSGMKAAMANMEVISNNISNASTIGFKKSTANFADIYPAGGGGLQIGLGVGLGSITQDFSAGGTEATTRPLDLSINKNGFFIVKDNATGAVSYTRAGRFDQDVNGYITSGNGRLQGFPAINGTIVAGGNVSDIQVSNAPIAAKATTLVNKNVNLDANSSIPSGPFDSTIASTYNFQANETIYDSLGNKSTLSLFFVKTAANSWNVNMQVNGTSIGSGAMTFSPSGALTSSTGLSGLSYSPTTGATSPQSFSISMTGSTQFANTNVDRPNTSQDGYPSGTLVDTTIDKDGVVSAIYSNNQTIAVGQIALATFQSPEGLTDIGNMSWTATSESGTAIIDQANSMNNLTSNQLELSNVDLTSEMVRLIGAQHDFQANAQVEQTFNEIMQEIIQL